MTSSNASLAANGVAGFFQGVQDRRDREAYDRQKELADLQMTQLKSDMSQKDFTRSASQALGQYMATNGADYQVIPNLYNKHFPDGGKMDVQRDPASGGYLVNMTKPDGTVMKGKKPLSFDEFGQIGAALTNPQHYLDARQKSADLREKYDAEYNLAARKSRLPGGAGHGTIDQLNWIQQNFGVDGPTAFEIYKTSADNPQKTAASLYSAALAARDKSYDPADKSRPSDETLWGQAVDAVQRMQQIDIAGLGNRYKKKPVDASGMTNPQIAPPAAIQFMNGPGNGVGPISSGGTPAVPIWPPAAAGITAMPGRAAQAKTPQASPAGDQPDAAAMSRLGAMLKTRQGKPAKLNNGQVWALNDKGVPVRRTDLETPQ
jgi:hypothetical protein